MRLSKLFAICATISMLMGLMASCRFDGAPKSEVEADPQHQIPLMDTNGLKVSDFLGFEAGATTKNQVIAVVGECHESYESAFLYDIYHLSNGESVSVCYASDGTVDIISKCRMDGKRYINTERLVVRKIYVSDFLVFQSGVTTREQVTLAVGKCQDYYGSGFIEEIYYTYDGAIISVSYNPNETLEWVLEYEQNGDHYLIKERLVE